MDQALIAEWVLPKKFVYYGRGCVRCVCCFSTNQGRKYPGGNTGKKYKIIKWFNKSSCVNCDRNLSGPHQVSESSTQIINWTTVYQHFLCSVPTIITTVKGEIKGVFPPTDTLRVRRSGMLKVDQGSRFLLLHTATACCRAHSKKKKLSPHTPGGLHPRPFCVPGLTPTLTEVLGRRQKMQKRIVWSSNHSTPWGKKISEVTARKCSFPTTSRNTKTPCWEHKKNIGHNNQ